MLRSGADSNHVWWTREVSLIVTLSDALFWGLADYPFCVSKRAITLFKLGENWLVGGFIFRYVFGAGDRVVREATAQCTCTIEILYYKIVRKPTRKHLTFEV